MPPAADGKGRPERSHPLGANSGVLDEDGLLEPRLNEAFLYHGTSAELAQLDSILTSQIPELRRLTSSHATPSPASWPKLALTPTSQPPKPPPQAQGGAGAPTAA